MLCVQAWRARNISTEFAESKNIFALLIVMDIIMFLGWPIIYLSQDTPNVLVLMSAFIFFLASMSTCLFLFVPKVLMVKNYGKAGPPADAVRLTGLSDITDDTRISDPLGGSSHGGEAVLTTKSPRELLEQIYSLKTQLHGLKDLNTALEDENKRLLQQLRDTGSPEDEERPLSLKNVEQYSPSGVTASFSKSMESNEGIAGINCSF